MKKTFIICTVLLTTALQAQSAADLKTEIEKIKTEVSALRADIQSVKSDNIYLKKVLDVKTPITEQINDNTKYSVIKVAGNKKDKTISIDFLVESKNEFKTAFLQDIVLIDIEGNEYKMNFFKSSHNTPDLSVNVPVKLTFLFDNIVGEPHIVKLFRFNSRNEPKDNSANFSKSNQEFRDLNVTWQ